MCGVWTWPLHHRLSRTGLINLCSTRMVCTVGWHHTPCNWSYCLVSGALPRTITWMVAVVAAPMNCLRHSSQSWILICYWMIMELSMTFWCVRVCSSLFNLAYCNLTALHYELSLHWHPWTYCPRFTSSTYQGNIQGPPCHLDQWIFGAWAQQATCQWNHCWHWSEVGDCGPWPHTHTEMHIRIAAVPSFPVLRRFPEGCGFKQWTGDNSKALMKVSESHIPTIHDIN